MNEHVLFLTNGETANVERGVLPGLFNVPLDRIVVTVHPISKHIQILLRDTSGVLRYMADISFTVQDDECEMFIFSPAAEEQEHTIRMSLAQREANFMD